LNLVIIVFIARDRLLHCSDYTKAPICTDCGSLISTSRKLFKEGNGDTLECHACGPNSKIVSSDMPYVIKYLAAELACMNVKMDFKFDKKDLVQDCLILDK
jgi:DNA-directed RNA polymerase I subunit RPA2